MFDTIDTSEYCGVMNCKYCKWVTVHHFEGVLVFMGYSDIGEVPTINLVLLNDVNIAKVLTIRLVLWKCPDICDTVN